MLTNIDKIMAAKIPHTIIENNLLTLNAKINEAVRPPTLSSQLQSAFEMSRSATIAAKMANTMERMAAQLNITPLAHQFTPTLSMISGWQSTVEKIMPNMLKSLTVGQIFLDAFSQKHFSGLENVFDFNRSMAYEEEEISESFNENVLIIPENGLVIDCPEIIAARTLHFKKIIYEIHNRYPEIFKLESRQFEILVAEILCSQGYQITLTPGKKDGGRDIIAYLDEDGVKSKYLYECKRYTKKHVGRPTAQQLFGIAISEKATKAFIVTTSDFSSEARNFANEHQYFLHLLNKSVLKKWIAEYVTKT